MEDNQVITNGDPLKDLYTEFNPKLNLAKSYDDFKVTMQDSNNRKAFFDEFNSKLNLANDYNQFENVLGLKKKDGTNVFGNGKLQFPSLDSKLFEQANIKPVSESTSFGRADIIDKAKMVESLPFVRDKAIHDKTIKNLLQKGKLAMQGSNSYNEEKQNVSNTLKDEEWMPSAMLPVEKDYVKNKAINTFSKFNNESTKSIEDKINSGDYIIENGKVKVKGGIADNFGQGIKDFVDGIGLSLNVAAAQSRGNNNEIKYYMNEFNKNKEKDKEFAAVGLPEKASKVVGEMSPYAIAGVLMPYADIPLMGLSNLSSNHQAIWNDDKMTMDQKVDAINNTTKDAFMTGNLQGAAFNMLGISDEKVAKDLLKRYEPTQKLYNNFKDVIKTVPSDVSKAAAIGGGTEFLNNLTKNKEGVKVDFGSIPEGALSMATLELIMKAPKVFTSGFKTLNEAIRTGYDKENPNWYNKYSKDVQDVLNQIVSSPEPVYNKLVNLLDVHPDAESQLAKQKIETFRDYYKSLPADLDPVQKNKALHILQLKTEAISDAQGAQDVTIRKSLENKASAYDNILQKVINKEPLDENKEPLLLSRFAAPIKEENIKEVKPTEVSPEADIEKRRQEELDEKVFGAGLGANRTLFNFKDNTVVSDSEIDLADKMIDNLISKSKNIESAIVKLQQLGYAFRGQTNDAFNKFVQDRIDGKTNKSFKEWREESGKKVNEINAKYDAELAALKEVKPTEVKTEPIVQFTPEGDLTDNSFSSIESNLKNIIKEASDKYNIPLNTLLEHYNINKNGEYFSSKTPILNIGKSTDFSKLIDTFKKAAFELYPDKVEELNTKINKNKQKLLDALERGDKNFKVDESLGRVYSAIEDINNKFQQSLKPEEVKPTEVKEKVDIEDEKLKKEINEINDEKYLKNYDVFSKRGFAKEFGFGKVPEEGADRVKYLKYRNEYLEAILDNLDFGIANKKYPLSDDFFDFQERIENEYEANEKELKNKGENLNKKQVKPEEVKPTEEKGLSMKGIRSSETRKLNEEANKIEPSDARSAALKYLMGENISQDAINELFGRNKPKLNTGERELKSKEIKDRDYIAKKNKGESLDDAAHSIWDNLSEEMQSNMTTQDIKDELENAISEHKTKSELAKSLIDGYKEEGLDDLEKKFYERYGDNIEQEVNNEFNNAPKKDVDIDEELIKSNYETEQQFQDAYWDAHQATYNAPKKAPSIEAEKPAITEEEKPVEKVNEFLHTGTEEERQKGLLKNLMSSGIPEDYKKGLEENGLTYKVSNQVEASDAAKAIIQSLGVTDALDIARGEKIDPSVGSAIYAESLNNLWSNERRLKADGKIEEANALGKQWSDITMEYANKLNSKGKWTAQTAYFYKTSPMGFAIRIENERVEQFQTWYENKEKDYKKVFTEILKSEEGQALLKEEVEKISKEERAKTRADKRQKIDDFFENAKLKGNNLYAIPIPTQVINGALEVMKKAVLAGESVTNAVSMAVEHISKEVKDWDKEKFRKEYEEKLNKVTNDRDNEKLLIKKIAELKRRLEEKDFSAEEYKTKRTLSEKEQAAKDEYDKVKKLYDEAKKESPEYIDKKAKQYLDKLRQRLRGIDEAKKEEIIRRSIKEIVKSGGLEYEDFKDIVSETIGIKKLTDEQKSQIESLTEQSNIADDLEQKFLDNPTRESIDAFRKAKANSLEADRKLFEMTSQKADIVGTLKSLITLNYLGASTLIKNYAQNVIYQATVRFPTSLAKRGIDQSVYGATYMGNKMFGTKVIKPSISLTDAQKGYFNEYRDGVIRGWDQMIKGVDEKDYFATNQYASSLNPRKSFNDLRAAMKGELFLSKGQKIDKFIQATLGWQPYAISRGMIYGDKPPRYAAQGAEALQIARKELGITDPFETEAFMLSPEKYAYNHLTKKAGLSSEDANKEAKSISKRIVDAGSVATFQNENMFNNLLSKIDEWATVKKDDQWTSKVVKPPVALLKATTIPFLKTPANIYWAYFKLANPALTMTKSLVEVGLAQHALKKGDLIGYREFNKKSKESFGTAMIGLAITAAASSLAAKGLIRTSVQEEDKAREKAGEGFFGKSNELNLGALTGGDDYWVDLSWFGPIGTIIDVRGRMMEDNKQKELKGEKIDDGVMNEIVSTMGYSVSSTLNSLIFDQGAKMVDAIRKGWSGGLNQVAVNNANALGNVVLGATIPAINKALAPEKADLAADNVLDQIANNQKQRNVFVTWAKGYPPSKVSIWGEPISQDRTVSGVLGAMLGFEKGSADKFGAILYNEQRRTGKNEFFPPVEDKKIKVNGNDVKITVEEKRDLDTYIGQARKTMVSPFINDKSIYTVFLRKGEEVADFTYSELTAGKNKAGQTISQEEADRVKLAALDIIYENGKKAGFSKFKEKYIQYQDATLNVEKLQKQALESAEKTIFKAKIEQPPQ